VASYELKVVIGWRGAAADGSEVTGTVELPVSHGAAGGRAGQGGRGRALHYAGAASDPNQHLNQPTHYLINQTKPNQSRAQYLADENEDEDTEVKVTTTDETAAAQELRNAMLRQGGREVGVPCCKGVCASVVGRGWVAMCIKITHPHTANATLPNHQPQAPANPHNAHHQAVRKLIGQYISELKSGAPLKGAADATTAPSAAAADGAAAAGDAGASSAAGKAGAKGAAGGKAANGSSGKAVSRSELQLERQFYCRCALLPVLPTLHMCCGLQL